jgi:hypothetical protein
MSVSRILSALSVRPSLIWELLSKKSIGTTVLGIFNGESLASEASDRKQRQRIQPQAAGAFGAWGLADEEGTSMREQKRQDILRKARTGDSSRIAVYEDAEIHEDPSEQGHWVSAWVFVEDLAANDQSRQPVSRHGRNLMACLAFALALLGGCAIETQSSAAYLFGEDDCIPYSDSVPEHARQHMRHRQCSDEIADTSHASEEEATQAADEPSTDEPASASIGDSCDVYSQEGCDSSLDCYYERAGIVGACGLSTGDKTQGEPCSSQTECSAGYVCRNYECRLSCEDTSECDLETQCIWAGDMGLCFSVE